MTAKRRADCVLAGVAVLFAAALAVRLEAPHSIWAQGFFISMEAALVGGIADWFAVTALFRKPLGFPWHTALMPRNRDKFIAATAHMVQNEFFTGEKLRRRLQTARLVEFFIDWLEKNDGRRALADGLIGYFDFLLRNMDTAAWAATLETLCKERLRTADLAGKAELLARWALATRRDEAAFDYLLGLAARAAARPATRRLIYEYLVRYNEERSRGPILGILNWLAQAADIVNLDDAADSLHRQLLQLLEELADRRHPLRLWLRLRLRDLARALAENEAWREAIAAWQTGVAGRLDLAGPLREMLTAVAGALRPAAANDSRAAAAPTLLAAGVRRLFDQYWESFKRNDKMKNAVEGYLKMLAYHAADLAPAVVGVVARDVLKVLSDRELNRLVYSKTAGDLAWIRINGSVVGALAGLGIFLALRLTAL